MKGSLYVLSGLIASMLAQQVSGAVPAQYIAKLYTEALGRAPDSGAWASRINYFSVNACNPASLAIHGRDVLLNTEFDSAGYTNAEKVLLLYRTILDREPDVGGLNHHRNLLDSGVPLSTVVDGLFNSPEFSQLSTRICSGDPYYFNVLGTGGYAIQLPDAPSLSQADLQASLNSAGPGGTVVLPRGTVVYLNSTLMIPDGVILTTSGAPLPTAHGKMARLVRGPSYSGGEAMVRMLGGARLSNVWVDGQRGAAAAVGGVPQPFKQNEINVQALSGANTQITSNFIANTAGWSSLQTFGQAEMNLPCQANVVSGNLITVYASSNSDTVTKTWADGISDSCEDSLVSNNQIIDATDVGIVLFRSQSGSGGAVQRSQVVDNVILNAGNSAYGAIAVDPLYVPGGCPTNPGFAGSYVGRNVFWTGPKAIIEIGLAVGTAEWFFSNGGCLGTGANVSDNSTNGFRARVNDGIAVQGMLDATVQSNSLITTLVKKGNCPMHNVSAGVSAGIASGSIQNYTNVALKDCI